MNGVVPGATGALSLFMLSPDKPCILPRSAFFTGALVDDAGNIVAEVRGSTEAETEARARYLAHTANTFPELIATLEWIAGQSNLFFAECSQAEEIIERVNAALTKARNGGER